MMRLTLPLHAWPSLQTRTFHQVVRLVIGAALPDPFCFSLMRHVSLLQPGLWHRTPKYATWSSSSWRDVCRFRQDFRTFLWSRSWDPPARGALLIPGGERILISRTYRTERAIGRPCFTQFIPLSPTPPFFFGSYYIFPQNSSLYQNEHKNNSGLTISWDLYFHIKIPGVT